MLLHSYTLQIIDWAKTFRNKHTRFFIQISLTITYPMCLITRPYYNQAVFSTSCCSTQAPHKYLTWLKISGQDHQSPFEEFRPFPTTLGPQPLKLLHHHNHHNNSREYLNFIHHGHRPPPPPHHHHHRGQQQQQLQVSTLEHNHFFVVGAPDD
jgi:hypothetical protein